MSRIPRQMGISWRKSGVINFVPGLSGVVFVLLLIPFIWNFPALAATSASDTLEIVFRDGGYQTSLPAMSRDDLSSKDNLSAPVFSSPSRSEGSFRGPPSSNQAVPTKPTSYPYTELLLWAIVFVSLTMIAVMLAFEYSPAIDAFFLRRRSLVEDARNESNQRKLPINQQSVFDDVKKLTAVGKYDEAAHLLLAKSLEILARRGKVVFAGATTCREIVTASALDPKARAALDRLVKTVELSYFGGHLVDRENLETCVMSFRILTEGTIRE